MKKTLIFLCALALLAVVTPAFAELFKNGGFENGTLDDWTISYGIRPYNGSETINYGYSWVDPYGYGNIAGVIDSSGKVATAGRTDNGTLPIGQSQTILPYVGNYMAIINDANGNKHATRLKQTSSAIIQADLDNQTKIYVDWGAALVEPSNADEHKPLTYPASSNFPYFKINVYKNHLNITSLLDSFYINSDQAAAAGWANIGTESWMPISTLNTGTIYYKAGQYVYNLAGGSFAVGDTITIEMLVSDCGLGGHGAYAFLDGIGTVQPPDPNGVPEPTTMLLLGLGLVGLAGFRRRS